MAPSTPPNAPHSGRTPRRPSRLWPVVSVCLFAVSFLAGSPVIYTVLDAVAGGLFGWWVGARQRYRQWSRQHPIGLVSRAVAERLANERAMRPWES